MTFATSRDMFYASVSDFHTKYFPAINDILIIDLHNVPIISDSNEMKRKIENPSHT